MIAFLPMYDRPETVAAYDTLWQMIRGELGEGPQALTRSQDLWPHWEAPDLLLGQTCSMPYQIRLKGKVQLVASPDYHLPGCPPGHYNSVVVARADDPRPVEDLMRARVMINQSHSQSGNGALWAWAGARGLRPNVIGESGGHVRSVIAIAAGAADVSVVDALSWRLMQRHDAFAGRLREIARTAPTPSTPYITALGQDVTRIRDALARAIAGLDDSTRETLSLYGIAPLPESAYLALPLPPSAEKTS